MQAANSWRNQSDMLCSLGTCHALLTLTMLMTLYLDISADHRIPFPSRPAVHDSLGAVTACPEALARIGGCVQYSQDPALSRVNESVQDTQQVIVVSPQDRRQTRMHNKEGRIYCCVMQVARLLALVPPWVRVYRIQRDIPMPLVTSGVEKGNLRELALARMGQLGLHCRDVRTREVGIQVWPRAWLRCSIRRKCTLERLVSVQGSYYGTVEMKTVRALEEEGLPQHCKYQECYKHLSV